MPEISKGPSTRRQAEADGLVKPHDSQDQYDATVFSRYIMQGSWTEPQ